MHRIVLAFRLFFQVLFDAPLAERVEQAALSQEPEPSESTEQPAKKVEKVVEKPKSPARSEALTLLATLQREARFIDFIMEPLDDYSDEQVGAAVRDVHRDCAKTLTRLFAIGPVVNDEENADVTVPDGFDAGRFRLTGNVAGDPPFQGQLVHHGWEAGICQLPAWTGTESAARVIAPAEVELK